MRVLFSWAADLKTSDCPLSTTTIGSLFKFVHSELRSSEIYTRALKCLGVKSVGSIGLRFCDDTEMRALQKTYRKLDRTTDILSFPTLEVPGVQMMMKELSTSERSWGDLVVSLPTVARGARRGRRSDAEELTEVLIHGFLHLLGLDHVVGKGVTPRHAREMKALQKKIFKAWLRLNA